MIRTLQRAVLALLIALCAIGAPSLAKAATTYKFELTEQSYVAGNKVPVTFKLVKKSAPADKGEAVSGAMFDAPKLIMLMPGMADMDGVAGKVASAGNGLYRVAADLEAPGDWKLTLTARVPGQTAPITETLALRVTP